MRWLIPFLAFPCVASVDASASVSRSERVHLKFSVKRHDFACEQERDVPLSETVVLCDDKGSTGLHLRMRTLIEKDPQLSPNSYMVKGWVEEIEPDGKAGLVSAPRIAVMTGEESEVSSSSNNGVDIDFKVTVTPVK